MYKYFHPFLKDVYFLVNKVFFLYYFLLTGWYAKKRNFSKDFTMTQENEQNKTKQILSSFSQQNKVGWLFFAIDTKMQSFLSIISTKHNDFLSSFRAQPANKSTQPHGNSQSHS